MTKKVYGLILGVSMIIFSCSKPTVKDLSNVIQNDNLKSFEKIRQQISIDTVLFFNGRSALHWALEHRANKISKKLIAEKFKLNAIDSSGQTPLLISILSHNKEGVDNLLKESIDLDAVDNLNGFTALNYAIHMSDKNLFKQLIEKGANYNLKNDMMGQTPLHLAIENNTPDIIRILLEKKALDTIRDTNGETAIDLAVNASTDVKSLFYDKFSIKDKEIMFINEARFGNYIEFLSKILDDKWVSKRIVNEAFVFSKDTLVAKKLLQKGASVNYISPELNYGAVHYAAISGNVIMLKFLISKGANINQLSKKSSMSVLMHASSLYGNVNDINRTVGGIQIGVRNVFYDQFAMSKEKNKENSLEVVKFLVSQKINLDFKNKQDENALYYAESTHNNEVAAYLKEIGIKETKKYEESKSDKIQRALNRF